MLCTLLCLVLTSAAGVSAAKPPPPPDATRDTARQTPGFHCSDPHSINTMRTDAWCKWSCVTKQPPKCPTDLCDCQPTAAPTAIPTTAPTFKVTESAEQKRLDALRSVTPPPTPALPPSIVPMVLKTVCKSGKYANVDFDDPVMELLHNTSLSVNCKPCPPGKYKVGRNNHKYLGRSSGRAVAMSMLQCSDCPGGRYGNGGSKSSKCSGICPAGRYGIAGLSKSKRCSGECAAGRYGNPEEDGLVGSWLCSGNCAPGRFSGKGVSDCFACLNGHYQVLLVDNAINRLRCSQTLWSLSGLKGGDRVQDVRQRQGLRRPNRVFGRVKVCC
jgi:hypothetical protein